MKSRIKKYDVFKAWMVKDACFSGRYECPMIGSNTEELPNALIPFDKAISSKKYDQWVHFYIHDVEFERIWNNPKQYLQILKRYKGVITPDFSLYRDMPLAMQIWNTYRNRVLGYWLEHNGVNIIPNISWGDERSYEFCFDGIRKKSIIAIGTYGSVKQIIDRHYLEKAIEELLKRIEPSYIVIYGSVYKELAEILNKENVPYLIFESNTFAYAKKVIA